MAARSIVTHQPPVTCEVCGRNLLRGEHAEVFLAGGQRRMVCELCVGRATNEGWLRAGDEHPVATRVHRGRRARTLMGRLRQLREPPVDRDDEDEPRPSSRLDSDRDQLADQLEYQPPEDWLGGEAAPRPQPVRAAVSEPRGPRHVHAIPTNAELKAARALEVFNAGEGPRRVAGVARSLGVPSVCARSTSEQAGLVSIVVAWELCWYRYEVDLGDEALGARLADQGLELEELPEEDRVANAGSDERGELQMLASRH